MTIVYVDVLFVLNAAIDYVLLLAAARVAGEPLRRKRFGLASLFGGAYAVAVTFSGPWKISRPASLLGAAFLMLMIAYGGGGQLWKQSVLFFALACALGGGMLAISLIGRQEFSLEQGIVYSNSDVKMLLLSAAVCYMISSLLFTRLRKHTSFTDELMTTTIEWNGRKVDLTVLIDTGNTLTDPITGKGVMVVEGKRLIPILEPWLCLDQGLLGDPVAALERLGKTKYKNCFRLLSYRSVGVSRGMLLALRVDQLRIGTYNLGPSLVALSPNPVSDGGGYHALMGPLQRKRSSVG